MSEIERQSRPVPAPSSRGGERILVVDDEPGVRTALEGVLADEGFHVTAVDTGEAGLEQLGRYTFDAVMLDVWLPGIDGLETLQKIGEQRFDTVVVMISGHGTIDTAVRATKLGAFDFIEKPLSLEKTLLVLRNALRQRRLERMNLHLLEQLSRDTAITGGSAAVARLRREVDAAAASGAAVLILGPQDSGRETVARRIHALSRQAEGPFVEVPCAALAPGAAETALFGRGDTRGRIALASGGSLFLEDANRLPAALQQRLAAQLDGAPVRLLVSCLPGEDDLDPELRRQADVLRIEVPPLRARREDVPPLAHHFLDLVSERIGRSIRGFTNGAMDRLVAAPWPGNVRQLENEIERVVALAAPDAETVTEEMLSAELRGPGGAGGLAPCEAGPITDWDMNRAVDRLKARMILEALREAGSKTRAAERLGIPRQSLQKMMKRLEISDDDV